MKKRKLCLWLTMAMAVFMTHWYIPRAAALEDLIIASNPTGVPKTGQETSYATNDDPDYSDPASEDIGCVRGTGSWANWNANGGRYIKASGSPPTSGTVIDNATGLEWIANPSDAGIGDVTSWAIGITVIESLTYAGHDDWRMPNIKELASLVDYGDDNPSIDVNFFTCNNSAYWSSTTYTDSTTNAFTVGFSVGGMGWSGKTGSLYVRPVRGGR